MFEEGAAIGYTLGAIGDESTDLGSTYLYTLEGAGEYNYLSEANITHVEFAEREYLKLFKPDVYDSRLTDDIWNSITVQGNGFIKFPVYKDCQYIVNANGFKIVIGGFVFSSDGNLPVSSNDVTIYSPGDVNGDGAVNTADIVETVNYILTPTNAFNKTAADLDNDRNVTESDVILIVKKILGE